MYILKNKFHSWSLSYILRKLHLWLAKQSELSRSKSATQTQYPRSWHGVPLPYSLPSSLHTHISCGPNPWLAEALVANMTQLGEGAPTNGNGGGRGYWQGQISIGGPGSSRGQGEGPRSVGLTVAIYSAACSIGDARSTALISPSSSPPSPIRFCSCVPPVNFHKHPVLAGEQRKLCCPPLRSDTSSSSPCLPAQLRQPPQLPQHLHTTQHEGYIYCYLYTKKPYVFMKTTKNFTCLGR